MEDIIFQIIWLGGCFTVGVVYFSSQRDTTGLQNRYLQTENCCKEDTSEKSTFFQMSTSQLAYLLTKSRRFSFIASVKNGLWTGLLDLRPNF